MPYQQYVQKMGQQGYIDEIKRKEAAGQTFTDQAAADAFKQANPSYFQQTKAPTQPTAAPAQPNTAPSYPTPQQPVSYSPQPNQWSYNPAQAQGQASNYASLQVDPQISQLKRSLEQAIANAQNQEGRITAAYSGGVQELERAKEGDQRRALESAIARGGGRAGLADWNASQVTNAYAGRLGQMEAQKAAELAAIANQLGLTQQQAQDYMTELEGRRGQLTAAELARLENMGYERDFAWDNAQWGRSMDMLPWTMLTPAQQHDFNIRYAESFDEVQPFLNQYGGAGDAQPIQPVNAAPAQQAPAALPASTSEEYWNQWGNYDAYATSQRQRYAQARAAGDQDLMKRLEADAARVGYTL